jgi:hypothetical protein
VAKKASARRLGDDRALVANDRVVDAGLFQVGTNRAEHPAGGDDDPHAGFFRGRDRRARARSQDAVFRDQRAVEIAGEDLYVLGKVARKGQLFGCRNATRSASCF